MRSLYLRQGHSYQDFKSPLPFVVQVAPGNTCETRLPEAWWDDLHIKYASTFLNAPTDPRCGPVENGWGRRCIIAQRPQVRVKHWDVGNSHFNSFD
ncbi:hypothetical protein FSHL1_008729 [Fusarium sambucinum]